MGTVTSNTINMRSGNMTLSMTNGVFPTTNFEVKEIAPIRGTWDVADESESADSVYFELGQFSFTVFDVLDDGSNLFEDILNLSTSLVTVNVSFTFNSGNTFSDEFKYTKKDTSYDRDARTVTIKSRTSFTNGTNISNFIAGATTTYVIEQDGGGGTQYDCVHMLDLIREGFGDQVNSSGTNSVQSDRFDTVNISNTYVAVDNAQASSYRVDDVIYWMAALEGGILGSILGYNFYQYRLDTTDAVTISQDDVESLEIEPGWEGYLSISVDLDNTNLDTQPQGTWSESDSATYNSLAKKTLSITFEPVPVNRADWQGLVGVDFYADAGTTLSAVVTDAGVDAYAAAYGADGTARISMTIFGLETVKPYEPITLGASFPSFIANTTWRASEIEYDFMEDKINVSAYRIA